MENRNLVVQSNRILQAKYGDTLSFWESFIIAKMCTMIQPQDEDFKEYKLFVKDLLEYNAVPSSGTAYKVVYEATQRLLERKISIRGVDENGKATIVDTHIIAGVERLEEPQKGENVYFKLIFVPKLRPYLLQLKKDFSVMKLADYKNLHTHTAIRMYEILVSYYGRGQRTVVIGFEELKDMLGLKDKYSRFEAFRRRILDDAQKRLAESTDYSFIYTVKKKGRSPNSIEFQISRNQPTALKPEKVARTAVTEIEVIESETLVNEAHERLFEELLPIVKRWGMASFALTKLIESNPEERIKAGVRVTEQAEKSAKIQNLAGYFVQAVKEGYTTGEAVKKQQLQEAAEKVKNEQAKENAEQARREQAKKTAYEKEKQVFLSILDTHPQALAEILELGKNGNDIRRSTVANYDRSKSLADNVASGGVLLLVTLQRIAKELYPEKFI